MNSTEPEGYSAAAAELEAILATLDRDDLDVDQLAGQVERAAELIEFCRARIEAARVNVEKVVANFDRPDEAGSDGESAGP
jgi:exodeoxyribonuclease VII small subunit